MDRRDRDNRKSAPRSNDARPPQQNGQNARRQGPNPQTPRLASYEDPNAYRSPGFQELNHNPYAIDYAGLPKDDEDDGQPQPGNSIHTPVLTHHGARNPRGMGGRRPDRSGTDPNAYRSPGFRDEYGRGRPQGNGGGGGGGGRGPRRDGNGARPAGDGAANPTAAREGGEGRGPSRRERRNERPRFETTCKECGAAAVVPFEPSEERPAFCKPCYEVKKVELGLGPGRRPPVPGAQG